MSLALSIRSPILYFVLLCTTVIALWLLNTRNYISIDSLAQYLKLTGNTTTKVCEIPKTTTSTPTKPQMSPPTVDLDDSLMKKVYKDQEGGRLQVNAGPHLSELIISAIPQVICPHPARLGVSGDGGKWTCSPWRHPADCAVYSLGVGGNPTFEQEIVKVTNCTTYSFDPDANYANLFAGSAKMKFFPYRISAANGTDNQKSFVQVMNELNHSRVEILKIDIEAAEMSVLPNIVKICAVANLTVCQILTEVHGSNTDEWRSLMATLEKAQFYLFSREANVNCAPWKACIEYSHLHRSCFDQYGVSEKDILFKNFP